MQLKDNHPEYSLIWLYFPAVHPRNNQATQIKQEWVTSLQLALDMFRADL